MAEHNPQHGRRQHFHRGRRGPDRRGTERRTPQREHAPEAGARESSRESSRENGVDVEQIMRDIRSRIAQRHGIELSNPQIQELAARRLEAILEPRNVKPQLLEQLRKSAGAAPEIPESAPLQTYEFEDTTLFETHRGILRFFRKLLHPILKLFFNPAPLSKALNTQARINKELAARELERERRQSEWNALQYELVQRMVLETSRISIEMQALTSRIESLSAKVDFNERRVRTLENNPAAVAAKPPQRHQEPAFVPPPVPEAVSSEAAPAADGASEGTRRRRRRRRGRRGGGAAAEAIGATNALALGEDDIEAGEGPEMDEDDSNSVTPETTEPPIAVTAPASPDAAPEPVLARPELPDAAPAGGLPAAEQPAALLSAPEAPAALPPATEPQVTPPQVAPPPAGGASPAPPPAALSTAPSPPRDEPTPANPVDHADPGPEDR